MTVLINNLVKELAAVQEEKSWIGTNFNDQLNALSEQDFFSKLADLHSIAEIISHLTTWRKESILKLKTGTGSITDADPTNWISNEFLRKIGKDQIIAAYNESLEQIILLLESKNDSYLSETYFDTDFKGYYSYDFLLKGVLQHDIYHLGQIGLIHNLIKKQKA
ncbi:DinB family protein [Lutimonas sp.]|uniref:DinB family protein n=1 Tax=Lutimonas sp. TaxID=1872403 RepID=UPI003D9B512C